MKPLRIGIVGTGFAARFHVECLRKIYGVPVELAGVTAKRAESRGKFGQQHGIPVFESVAGMLDQVDILDICSPPSTHEEFILAAASAGKGIFCEKPLTGFFGPAGAGTEFHAGRESKAHMLEQTLQRMETIATSLRSNGVFFGYAENFVYAPSVQKEREIVEKTGAQILRMTGEESHNGSPSPVYGIWNFAGGGSLMGKGCHPLGGMLYLKRREGIARNGQPIRPKTVTARTHQLSRIPGYKDAGFIRTDYHDVEDYGIMHVTFEDGTIADAISSEIVLGGMYDYIEVFANNHRTRCHISPTGIVDTYNPKAEQFKDVYLLEKISTKEGWSPAASDEHSAIGYRNEFQDFVTSAASGESPQSDFALALDTTSTIYAAYLSDERGGAEVEIPLLKP